MPFAQFNELASDRIKVGGDADPLTDLHGGHTSTNLDDRAGHLVADYEGMFGCRKGVPVLKHANVGTAHRRTHGPQQHFAAADLRRWQFLQPEVFFTVEECRLHKLGRPESSPASLD